MNARNDWPEFIRHERPTSDPPRQAATRLRLAQRRNGNVKPD